MLVGPSGSGKSTALRMLAGLEDVDLGAIYIGDRDVSNLPPKERDIAMVFQNYALYPHMSVAENMGFALKLKGVNKAERDAKVRRRPPGCSTSSRTSTASRRRSPVASASAWPWAGRSCASRSVFLMDEPLSNLDAKLRVETRANIAALQARLGTTTLYVTHDQVEAMTMGHRVAILKEGGFLQQVDTPRNLYDKPVNAFVAGFIGSPAMNLRPAALVPGGAKLGNIVVPLHADAEAEAKKASLSTRSCSGCATGVVPRRREPGLRLGDQGEPGRGARRRRLHLRRGDRRPGGLRASSTSCGSTAGCRRASATSSTSRSGRVRSTCSTRTPASAWVGRPKTCSSAPPGAPAWVEQLRQDGAGRVSPRGAARAISARVTAAATDAFSDSAGPAIGIATVRSQVSPTSRDSPLPSDPTTTISGWSATSRSSRLVVPRASRPTTNRPALSRRAALRTRLVTCATGRRAAVPAEVRQAAAVTPAARRSGTTRPWAPNATAERINAPRLRRVRDAVDRDKGGRAP